METMMKEKQKILTELLTKSRLLELEIIELYESIEKVNRKLSLLKDVK
jgi:hypothetical protein